ncbi:MAG: septal ring lytic transglycosylase RlpA family protein [Verrucomicrobiales bacterium]|nr:septal ring lytic transglycosylase RlpA family protein [Verrucomicrobiales bacterium]
MKKYILWLSVFVLTTSLALYMVTHGAIKSTGLAQNSCGIESHQTGVADCNEAGTPEIEATAAPPSVNNEPSTPAPATLKDRSSAVISSRGKASFYSVITNGTRTASGTPLNDSISTAAHRTLPFGTRVRVTNLSNGRSDVVKITDRGPFVKNRIIDVSQNAAKKLGMVEAGIIAVEIEVLSEALNPLQTPLAKE